jgi:hypothetical protein
VRLTGYVVIELKTGKFQPEYAGKLNFSVALVDDLLRREYHNETVGILICGTKNDRSVRYSLSAAPPPPWPSPPTPTTSFPKPNNKLSQTRDTLSPPLNGLNPDLRPRRATSGSTTRADNLP